MTATVTPTPTATVSSTPTPTPTPILLGKIGDRVWHDANRDGQQDAGEEGIQDVRLDLVQDGRVVDTQFTAANGSYLFRDLTQGAYTIDIDDWTLPPSYNLVSGSDPNVVWIDAGQDFLTLDFGYAPAPTPTPMPPSTVDLRFMGWEWVQVVGSFNPRLIEDKRTVVRVYVGVNGAEGPIHNVRGRLLRVGVDDWNSALRSDNSITVDPAEDAVQDNREEIAGTLNFTLPRDWREGGYYANVWINYDGSVRECPRCADNNIGTGAVNFFDPRVLDVVMVKVRANETKPSDDERSEVIRWAKKIYPINAIRVWISAEEPLDADYDYTDRSGDGCGDGWADLLDDLWWLNFWTDDPVENLKYYGIVDERVPTGFSGCGLTPGDESAGQISPGTDRGGQTFAHEIGHNIGRQHAPCRVVEGVDPNYPQNNGSLDVYGLDPATMTLFPAATTFDVMSYCSQKWISAYNYYALFDHFNQRQVQTAAVAQFSAAPQPAADGNYLIVAGQVEEGQLRDLGPFYRLSLPSGSHDQPSSGAYSLELQDAGGQIIFTRFFDLVGHHYNPGDIGAFRQIIPFSDGVARIVVKHGNVVLGLRTVSTNGAIVQLLTPNGGENWPASSTQIVSWSGSDSDGDSLFYSLQYSSDGGTTWTALATNLLTTTYTVDTSALAGSAQGLIRVIATDGVNTTADASDAAFGVARKAPQIYLLDPASDAVYAPGVLAELAGLASDVEDGPLGDTALTWRSDRQGILGSGETLTVQELLSGTHTLTLTAIDSDGMASTASVTIYVGYRVHLPLILR